MAPATKEAQRAELHKTIWRIANDLRGSVDGWDFKSYVLGFLFYRCISGNITAYINAGEHEARNDGFDYARLPNDEAEAIRADLVAESYFIYPRELFVNVRERATTDQGESLNLNQTLQRIFTNIEGSAVGTESEADPKGLFDDLDVNSSKLGPRSPSATTSSSSRSTPSATCRWAASPTTRSTCSATPRSTSCRCTPRRPASPVASTTPLRRSLGCCADHRARQERGQQGL